MSPRAIVKTPDPHPKQQQFIESKAKRIIVRAGRRGGKTTGIAIRHVERFLDGRRQLYMAPTQEQTEKFWFEVTQALTDPIEKGIFAKNESGRFIELKGTEQRIKAKTAWNPDTARGDYGDDVTLDEFQLMDEDTWKKVVAPMMLDRDGTTTFIYTPPAAETAAKSRARDPMYAARLYQKAQKDTSGRWATYTFTSHDNPHLSQIALAEIILDMDDRDYRLEIMAEDIFETPGALWDQNIIDQYRVETAPELLEVVTINIDPSKSSKPGSDECGIVPTGLDGEAKFYVLEDITRPGASAPEAWGVDAVQSAIDWSEQANYVYIVAESNAGGEMIRSTLQPIMKEMGVSFEIKLVPAVANKLVRAKPVRARWGRNQCRIVGHLPRLEYEMCNWIDGSASSPNRMDAMVHGGRELMLHDRTISVGSVSL
jgi:hypothetical protein